MKFKCKKKRGINRKTCRFWFSAEGYRIIWRKDVQGISVKSAFQVCVRTIVPGCFEGGKTEMWDFVEHNKHLYKTMKASIDACEKHHKLWSQAAECTGIRAIQELFGRQPACLPKWVAGKLDRRILAILLDYTPGRKTEAKYGSDEKPGESKPEKTAAKTATKTVSRTTVKTAAKRKQRSDKGKKRGPRKPKS